MKTAASAVSRMSLLLLAFACAASAQNAASLRDQVRAYRTQHEAAILRDFAELLAIPNRASDTANIRRNAEHIAGLLRARGIETRLLEHPGAPPVVYGELRAPGATRTIAVYVHYDGQPAEPADWGGADPWKPILRDKSLEDGGREISWPDVARPPSAGPIDPEWRVYARSSSDDKAPIPGWLAALDALRDSGIAPSVNVKFFFEGEEEAGSPHLEKVLKKYGELLKADLWLLCDGPVHQTRRPQVVFGARGVTDVEITVYGPARALHSGHYGNWAPNPAAELARLLSGLRDAQGRILIAGFYDDVRPLTDSERQALATVPATEPQLRQALGLAHTEGNGRSLVELSMLPALNIRGLRSGAVGDSARNAIPTEASASIDFRLVPDQTPATVRRRVEDHLRAQGYWLTPETPSLETRRRHARIVKLEWGMGYPAARTSLDHPAAQAITRAVEDVAGPVIKMPTLGGSVPMHLFEDVLKTPAIILPIANHDNNQHAANENLRLQNLWDGIEIYAAILARLGPAWSSSP
jgi:acetylornithine deacetylase/succinyl-diaminopimelate desuccinylase-like protein